MNLPSAIVRRGIFHSLRFELAFVLVFGVIAPVLALAFFEAGISHGLSRVMNWIGEPVVTKSILGVAVSTIVSIAILRRLRFYPGVAVARSILPVLGMSSDCFWLRLPV